MRYFEIASKLIAQEPNDELPGHGLGLRHIQIALQFFLAAIFVAMNMTLPITIVAMTIPKDPKAIWETSFPNWSDQSLILVSQQCGYAVTQLFGGCICRTYGYQFVTSFAMFLCSAFNVLLPTLTSNFGSQGLIVCLLIQGASQGFVLPVIPDFLDRWVPLSERNSIGTLMFAANALGAALATKLAAFISNSFLGWVATYYILGATGFVWTYFSIQFGRNSPEYCDDITAEEREFIKFEKYLKGKVPWRKILASPILLAIWAAHAGTFWALWLITAEIPTYLASVLGYSLTKDGSIISDAYFMSWLFSFIMSGTTGYLIKSKILTMKTTRIISQSIASCLTALCLIFLGFLSDPHWVVFILIAIFVALTASFWGFMLTYNDITKNRGMISEVGGFIATTATIFPAILKQFIVTDQSDRTQWAIVFWITAVVLFLSNAAFFVYSAGEIEELDFSPIEEKKVETNKCIDGESKYLKGRTNSPIRSYQTDIENREYKQPISSHMEDEKPQVIEPEINAEVEQDNDS